MVMGMGILTRIRRRRDANPHFTRVRFQNGPLAGRLIPVNCKYLKTGVFYEDEDFIFGDNNMSVKIGRYNVRTVTRVHYLFEQQSDGSWAAYVDE
jgi:hypothetical protein